MRFFNGLHFIPEEKDEDEDGGLEEEAEEVLIGRNSSRVEWIEVPLANASAGSLPSEEEPPVRDSQRA